MLFSTFRSLTIAALFIVFVAGARSQTVVTNNLVQSSSDPVQNWSSILKVGQSFTANASGNLSSISLNLM